MHPSQIVVFLCWASQVKSDSEDESSVFGYKKYTEYRRGSSGTKIVLSASHGGELKPPDVATRIHGCYSQSERKCIWRRNCGVQSKKQCYAATSADDYTKQLAIMLADELEALSGQKAHLVINHLHRSKMDANREINEAALGEKDAVQAWTDYHKFMKEAREAISGMGLVLDIHGQSHKEKWIELGYLISSYKLDSGQFNAIGTSIRSLSKNVNMTFEELVRGPHSFGGYLDSKGYKVVPSPSHPGPDGGRYFAGGYITRMYGSRGSGAVDSIQIESPKTLRSSGTAPQYAKDLADVIHTFIQNYYMKENYMVIPELSTPASDVMTSGSQSWYTTQTMIMTQTAMTMTSVLIYCFLGTIL